MASSEDLQRLQKAAAGLTESGIGGTLAGMGIRAPGGLASVPTGQVAVACASLQAAFRPDVIEPPDARERFEQPGNESRR